MVGSGCGDEVCCTVGLHRIGLSLFQKSCAGWTLVAAETEGLEGQYQGMGRMAGVVMYLGSEIIDGDDDGDYGKNSVEEGNRWAMHALSYLRVHFKSIAVIVD